MPSSRRASRHETALGSVGLPRPARYRRPTWRDPRLAGGMVLIGLSVALGAWAVGAAADTQELYAVTRDVVPGTDLSAEGVLTLVASHPGTGDYLDVEDLSKGSVATRSLSAGELVPSSAVAPAGTQDLRSVVLSIASGLPSGTGAGDVVDLWTLPSQSLGGQQAEAASQVSQGLIVAGVGEQGSDLIGAATTQVEVLVPSQAVAEVLTAVAGSGSLVLVPTGQAG